MTTTRRNQLLPTLNHDVTRQIILHLLDSDPETGDYSINSVHNLHKCILVNKEWCKLAMPMLWAQPFHFQFDPTIGVKAIETYLKCLDVDDDDRKLLLEQNMNVDLLSKNGFEEYYDCDNDNDCEFYEESDEEFIFHNQNHNQNHNHNQNQNQNHNTKSVMSLDFITNSDSPSPSPPSYKHSGPMFYYPAFLRRLLYESMYRSVEQMTKHLIKISGSCDYTYTEENDEEEDDDDDNTDSREELLNNKTELLVKTILQLLLKYQTKLSGLWFAPDSPYNDIHKYYLLEDYKEIFEDVKVLDVCCLFRRNDLFLIAGKICNQLKYLHIHTIWSRHHEERHIDDVGERVGSLIKSQKALESFRLTNCKAYTRVFFQLFTYHKDTLRRVTFDQTDFHGCPEWTSISRCSNLELLEILQCSNMDDMMVRPLISHNTFKKGKFDVRYLMNPPFPALEIWAKNVNNDGAMRVEIPERYQLDENNNRNHKRQ